MTARIVDCPTPRCGGKAEFLSTGGIYLCIRCGGRFAPEQIRLPAAANGVTPFHGRVEERARLEGALESARNGRTQVVLMHGEPGIGKTALMRAFYHGLASPASDPDDYWPDVVGELSELSRESAELCEARRGKKMPFLWLAGQAPSPQTEACLPLHPWEKALEGLRNLPLGASPRGRATDVAKVVGKGVLDIGADLLGIGLVKTLVETTVGVGKAIGGNAEDRLAISALAPETAQAMQQDIVRVVGLLAGHPEIPVLVISLDDLQWADEATTAAIAACCRMAAGAHWKLLLLLGYRDNEVAANRCAFARLLPVLQRYEGDGGFDLIDLPIRELDTMASEALVRDYFPAAGPDLLQWLVLEIGGTPFYLHQFCSLLKERGDVVAPGIVRIPGGVGSLRQGVAEGRIPVKLEAVLKERLDRLDESQRHLLAYASVEGRSFTDTYLERVVARLEPATGNRDAIRRHLEDCERLHRLIRSSMEASPVGWPFEFLHDLLHVEAGRLLSPSVRDTCLDALRDWLLERWRDPAFDSLPLTERRRVLDRLVALVPVRVPLPEGLDQQQLTRLLLNASDLYLRTGTLDAAISTLLPLARAIDAGTIVPGTRWSGLCFSRLGDLMRQRGELGQAEAFYRKDLALSERLAQDEADAQAQRDLGISYERLGDLMLQRGELGQAEAFYRKDLALSERLAQDEADAQAQRDLAVSLERMIRQSIMTKKAEEAGRFLSRMRSVVSRLPGFMRGPFEESIVDFSKEIASLEHGDGG